MYYIDYRGHSIRICEASHAYRKAHIFYNDTVIHVFTARKKLAADEARRWVDSRLVLLNGGKASMTKYKETIRFKTAGIQTATLNSVNLIGTLKEHLELDYVKSITIDKMEDPLKTPVKDRIYPYYGVFNDDLIVLFTERHNGILLHAYSNASSIGRNSGGWSESSYDYHLIKDGFPKLERKV